MKEQIQKLRTLRNRISAGGVVVIVLLVAALFILKKSLYMAMGIFAVSCVWQLAGMHWLRKNYKKAYMQLFAQEGVRSLMKDAQYAYKANDLDGLPVKLGLVEAGELLPGSIHYHVIRGSIRGKAAVMEESAFTYQIPGGKKKEHASFAGTVLHMPGSFRPGLVAAVGNPFPSLPATQRLAQRGFEPAVLPEGCQLPERTVLLTSEDAQVQPQLIEALRRFAQECETPACLLCTEEGLTLMLSSRFFTAAPNLREAPEEKHFVPLRFEDIQQALKLAEMFQNSK